MTHIQRTCVYGAAHRVGLLYGAGVPAGHGAMGLPPAHLYYTHASMICFRFRPGSRILRLPDFDSIMFTTRREAEDAQQVTVRVQS